MATKQFGDAVILVKNGAEMNALVFQSQLYPDVEHLAVVYLDPSSSATVLTGMQVDTAIKKEFGVTAWAEGKPVGWKEVADKAQLERVIKERDDLLATVTPTPEQTAELDKDATTPDQALPSAADLDTVAAEQRTGVLPNGMPAAQSPEVIDVPAPTTVVDDAGETVPVKVENGETIVDGPPIEPHSGATVPPRPEPPQ